MRSIRPPAFLDLSTRRWSITSRWQVWGIIALLLIGTVALAWLTARFNPIYGLIASTLPLVFISLAFVAPRREFYPFVILALALFVPLSLPTGRESRLVMSLVFTMLVFVVIIVYSLTLRRRLPFGPSPVNRPFVAWAIVVIISLIWSNLFRDYSVYVWSSFPFVQAASAAVMILSPFVMLLTGNFLRSERQLQFLVGLFLFAGVIGLVPVYTDASFLVNVRGLFNLWVIALSAGLAFFHTGLRTWMRVALFGLAGAYVAWGIFIRISWLAGWLPGVIALGVLILIRTRVGAIVAGLVVVVVIAFNMSWVNSVFSAEDKESGETRLAAWEVNWSITRDHLLFGTGPAGYAAYYMTYYPRSGMATHSNYIDIFAETGIIGFAVYAWLIGSILWVGLRVNWRVRHDRGFTRGIATAALAGAIACTVIMGFGDWLIPFAYTQTIMGFDYTVYSWIFMGTLLYLDRQTSPKPEVAAGAES